MFYAIADVAAFVGPGSLVEVESLKRGVTLYAPDRRTSLHPEIINEDAASLRPGATRPAVLWTIDLDPTGKILDARLERSFVRVAEAISYRAAQAEINEAACREPLALLAEIGKLRQDLERERGAVSLPMPTQEVQRNSEGHLELVYDETLPVEGWNAQISLLTGIAAAHIMVDAGVGLLRTLPPADDDTLAALRRTAKGLGVEWPPEQSYADRVRQLDPNNPREVALLMRSARGLRGAGYLALDEASQPDHIEHSAIASIYAHVTAPLRRVCDRFSNEIILALCADHEPPTWAVELLPELPSIMGRSRQREQTLERAVLDYVEAKMLEPSIGHEFDAIVVNHRRDAAIIQIREPAIVGEVEPKPQLGQQIRVRLIAADPSQRRIRFERVD